MYTTYRVGSRVADGVGLIGCTALIEEWLLHAVHVLNLAYPPRLRILLREVRQLGVVIVLVLLSLRHSCEVAQRATKPRETQSACENCAQCCGCLVGAVK